MSPQSAAVGSRSCSTPVTAPVVDSEEHCFGALVWPLILGGQADGHYDHRPEPTEENLSELAPIVPAFGASVGFAQDPDADRLAIIDENGRYIGEEQTLALAAVRRLGQQEERSCSTFQPRV